MEEWTAAYLQYYRENANWNERTAAWTERVGLPSIIKALENGEDRRALVNRIEETLSYTKDPWKEIIKNDDLRKNFEPLSGVQTVNG
ncbi:Nitrite reductase [NAD(P)H] [compost metagenome]